MSKQGFVVICCMTKNFLFCLQNIIPCLNLKYHIFPLFPICKSVEIFCAVVPLQKPILVRSFVPVYFFLLQHSQKFCLNEIFPSQNGTRKTSFFFFFLLYFSQFIFQKIFVPSVVSLDVLPPTFEEFFNSVQFDTPFLHCILCCYLSVPDLCHLIRIIWMFYPSSLKAELSFSFLPLGLTLISKDYGQTSLQDFCLDLSMGNKFPIQGL